MTVAQTVAGTILKVSASLPSTYDYTGYSALSYTTVGEVTDMGSLGKKYTLVTHSPIDNRRKLKFRGDYDTGQLALKMAKATLAATDAGQTIMQAAGDTDISFEFILQDGSKMYFSGKVMSFVTMIGTINQILGADVQIEITTDIVEHT